MHKRRTLIPAQAAQLFYQTFYRTADKLHIFCKLAAVDILRCDLCHLKCSVGGNQLQLRQTLHYRRFGLQPSVYGFIFRPQRAHPGGGKQILTQRMMQ